MVPQTTSQVAVWVEEVKELADASKSARAPSFRVLRPLDWKKKAQYGVNARVQASQLQERCDY